MAATMIDLSAEFKHPLRQARSFESAFPRLQKRASSSKALTIEDIEQQLSKASASREEALNQRKEAGPKEQARVARAALNRQTRREHVEQSMYKRLSKATNRRAFALLDIQDRNAKLVKKARSVAVAERRRMTANERALKETLEMKVNGAEEKRQQKLTDRKTQLAAHHAAIVEKLSKGEERLSSMREAQLKEMQDAQLKRSLGLFKRQQRLFSYNKAVQSAAQSVKALRDAKQEGSPGRDEEEAGTPVALSRLSLEQEQAAWRFSSPESYTHASAWSPEVEETFRLQESGWRDLAEYTEAQGVPERWENGWVSKLVTKDRGYYVYWGRERECKDEFLAMVLLRRA